MITNTILLGDNKQTLKSIPDNSVDCCITSPPYFNLRDYGSLPGQIGLEESPEEYINNLIIVFSEVYRILKDSGTCWVNIGDSYNGSGKNNGNTKSLSYLQSTNTASHVVKVLNIKSLPPKSLIGIPWRFAFAMVKIGFILRQDIIWSKPSVMPESVKDRFCKSHEYIFLFSKKPKYYFNHEYALEPALHDGRKKETRETSNYENAVHGKTKGINKKRWIYNELGIPMKTKRDVWTVALEPTDFEHYAMFPQKLILPCILCGCPENGIVLDPFVGSGTTALVALKNFRKYIGCEINPDYIKIAESRIANEKGLFDE